METITMDRLSPGSVGRIVRMETRSDIRQRLLDLGFTEGGTVKMIMSAAAGDPIAFGMRGAVIALRQRDCRGILVKKLSGRCHIES